MGLIKRRVCPPFDGQSLTPVGLDALDRPPWRPILRALLDGSVVIENACEELAADVPDPSFEDFDPSDNSGGALRDGEWVGSDGSPYSVSDNTVSILAKGGAIELSTSDLVAVFEGVPRSRLLCTFFPDFPLDRLSPSMLILDLCRTRDGWRLLGGRIHDDKPSEVWLCSLLISADGKELTRENAPRKVAQRESIRCWRAVGAGRAAVGYASGRIEILALNEDSPRMLAVGFTLTPPEDMAVTRGPTGPRLVVIAGDVVWFDLGSLDLSPAKIS